MPELEVKGATLHYQTCGTGPLLLCISGANGDYEIWQPMAECLRQHFTVAFYDRRGFSRSILTGAQDYPQRLAVDADDAAALIAHLSPDEPATVIGNSSGAIVALTLLRRHSDRIRTLVSHEPPALKLQPDSEALVAEQLAIYDTYRTGGIVTAIERFAVMVKAEPSETAVFLASFDSRQGRYRFANALYWFERELTVYPLTDMNSDMFQPYASKLLVVNGRMTRKDALQFRANELLARELKLELELLPGAHVGYITHAAEFAEELQTVLKKRDSFYAQL